MELKIFEFEVDPFEMAPVERLYRSAAHAYGVKRLEVSAMSEEQARIWSTPSPEALSRYQESQSEQTEAWREIRSLPFGR